MKIRNPFKKKKKIELLLTDWEGADGCLATDRIAVDGMPVGYMYREEPADNYQKGMTAGGVSLPETRTTVTTW